MSEVMSQGQIDLLLGALSSGTMEISEAEETSSEKKVRVYDFKSPKKFTRDRLRFLDSIYQHFARMLTSYLSGLLQVACEIDVEEIEEERYLEFSNALRDQDALASLQFYRGEDNPGSGGILMQLTNDLAFQIIDLALGSTGGELIINRGFSDIELFIYQNLIEHMIPFMQDAWSNYVDVEISFARLENSPSMVRSITINETVVIVVLRVLINKVKGYINICIPANIIEEMFKLFDNRKSTMGNRRKNSKTEDYSKNILQELRNSPLEIVAELGKTEITLHDLYKLQTGDIIPLDKTQDADITMFIEGKPWFDGRLGSFKKNMAVRISKVHSNQEQRKE